jgi:hypothetical protein
MAGRTVVVPIKTIIDVLSDANIVTSGIDIAANDVDETVSDPSHEGVTGTDRARLNSSEFPWLPSFVRSSCPRARFNRAKQLGFERRWKSAFARCASYGETAFACRSVRGRLDIARN